MADPGFFKGGALWDLRFEHMHTVYSSMKPTPLSCTFKEIANDTKCIGDGPIKRIPFTNFFKISVFEVVKGGGRAPGAPPPGSATAL